MKKWYESKTIWFNIITAGLLIAEGLNALHVLPTQVIAIVSLVGNVILRVWYTNATIDKAIV